LCGDSIVSGIDSDGISSKFVKASVKTFPGSTTEDMKDYIKPVLKKSKPDCFILHVETNDLIQDTKIDSVKNLSCLVSDIKSNLPECKVVISNVCYRSDRKNISNDVISLNEKIKPFCAANKLKLIDHKNIDRTCLSRKQLHLNQKGMKNFALNLKNFLHAN